MGFIQAANDTFGVLYCARGADCYTLNKPTGAPVLILSSFAAVGVNFYSSHFLWKTEFLIFSGALAVVRPRGASSIELPE